ncbi:MAG: PTS glucitol/sorbitol transporter subunit IIA [Acidimicrobiia bacterium]
MTTKYHTTVTSVGEMAAEFAAEGILVFFGPDAPEELHEFAIITTAAELAAPVEIGDTVHIDKAEFPVLSVGAVANDNLAGLGHLVVKFNGLTEPELPGDVSLPAVGAPEITAGTVILIVARGV